MPTLPASMLQNKLLVNVFGVLVVVWCTSMLTVSSRDVISIGTNHISLRDFGAKEPLPTALSVKTFRKFFLDEATWTASLRASMQIRIVFEELFHAVAPYDDKYLPQVYSITKIARLSAILYSQFASKAFNIIQHLTNIMYRSTPICKRLSNKKVTMKKNETIERFNMYQSYMRMGIDKVKDVVLTNTNFSTAITAINTHLDHFGAKEPTKFIAGYLADILRNLNKCEKMWSHAWSCYQSLDLSLQVVESYGIPRLLEADDSDNVKQMQALLEKEFRQNNIIVAVMRAILNPFHEEYNELASELSAIPALELSNTELAELEELKKSVEIRVEKEKKHWVDAFDNVVHSCGN